MRVIRAKIAGAWIAGVALVLAVMAFPRAAHAQLGAVPSYIVVDAASGTVLASDHADEPRFPASLTKLMTLYLAFQALRDHRITLQERVPVSAHAASMEPVKLWLTPKTRITVEQCILAMVTLSANDAASALGELLGGSESRFARMMTRRAHALGMKRTVFRNASGLPDPAQVTTAHDMATLARALIRRFPSEYHYFGVARFVFNGRTIIGHDPMLGTYPGVDGMKTGFTSAAGFNLATSGVRDGRRLVAIILGAPSDAVRDAEMVRLLDQGFGEPGLVLAAQSHSKAGIAADLIPAAYADELPAASIRAGRTRRRHSEHVRRASYSVQVGSFSSHKRALSAARRTVATVGGVAHLHRFVLHGRAVWRARVVKLTRADARRICPPRKQSKGRCMILGPKG